MYKIIYSFFNPLPLKHILVSSKFKPKEQNKDKTGQFREQEKLVRNWFYSDIDQYSRKQESETNQIKQKSYMYV